MEDLKMGSIDEILQARVAGKTPELHSACYMVASRQGTVYAKAHGWRDLEQKTEPTTLDSLHWIASLTKLSTAIATLIAVEKGLITLDENVREIVPELADLDLLEGLDDNGTPRLRKCTSPISLRQLLSHSSGFCYDQHHEGLRRWASYVGKKESALTGSLEGYRYPLIFEPGAGWSYGSGMDWAGRTIEIVSNQDLESFMKTNIWIPLGMTSTTFKPWSLPDDVQANAVELVWRSPDKALVRGKSPFGPATDCCGGVGLFSTPNDQMKLLTSLIRNEPGVLSRESLDELLSPQTEDPSYVHAVLGGAKKAHVSQTWPQPQGSRGDFGLSASINAEAFPGRRAAKSGSWQGMPGVHAWLDRTTGLAGLFTTQLLPPGDATVTETFCRLEEMAYRAHSLL